MKDAMTVFDRRAVRQHRDRAASRWPAHEFLVEEVGARLAERLEDVKRSFPLALDLGCHGGTLAPLLIGRKGIERLIQCDLSPAMARLAAQRRQPTLVADEEALPFAAGVFDLVVSCLSLHWVNDLPGTLLQARRSLKPDGLFLAAMLGGESLFELRVALLEAESELEGGASPRVSPLAELRDTGGLLQRAGFALPVVDRDTIEITYPDPLTLLRDLRGMGEGNAVALRRRSFTRRSTLLRALEIYAERFARSDGRLPLSLEVLTLTGWAPHESQQQPLRPGSAAHRLAEALGGEELPAGDEAPQPRRR